MTLQMECVPAHMTLQGFDNTIGTLLRRGIITCVEMGGTHPVKILALQKTKHLAQAESLILLHLTRAPQPVDKLVLTIAKKLSGSERGVRAHITRLKKRGYVEVLNIPKRGIYITEAGKTALRESHVI